MEMENFSVWLYLIYCKANDVNNKAFDYCKTMNVVIEKKIKIDIAIVYEQEVILKSI